MTRETYRNKIDRADIETFCKIGNIPYYAAKLFFLSGRHARTLHGSLSNISVKSDARNSDRGMFLRDSCAIIPVATAGKLRRRILRRTRPN